MFRNNYYILLLLLVLLCCDKVAIWALEQHHEHETLNDRYNNRTGVLHKLLLPDTTDITGQLTTNQNIDKFFELWIVFHNDDVQLSDEPFTIFAPVNTVNREIIKNGENVKQVILNHIVLGIELKPSKEDQNVTSLANRHIRITKRKNNKFYANDALILDPIKLKNGVILPIDNYVFDRIQLNQTQQVQQLSINLLANVTKPATKEEPKSKFIEELQKVLLYFKDGVRVFQHFLTKSNISNVIKNDAEYTVLVPIDFAFQRWHPIDWGFYPFSVPEFTEYILRNHFIIGKYQQRQIKENQQVYTLGGNKLEFTLKPNLQVDGVTIAKGDTPFPNGNLMFINEVLFVTESVVSQLHQQHKDKETPPLLAFPWFGAQFLSHAFLALERDKRFTQITRFLNLADLAAHVSGTGYTFFVPTDQAFEELGLNKMPDNYLSNGDGLKLLLNHFTKRRLYKKDFVDNTTITTIGGNKIFISRNDDNITLNGAHIIEGEVFVYNLGTMYFMDHLLFTFNETTTATNKEHEVIDTYPTIFKKNNQTNPIK